MPKKNQKQKHPLTAKEIFDLQVDVKRESMREYHSFETKLYFTVLSIFGALIAFIISGQIKGNPIAVLVLSVVLGLTLTLSIESLIRNKYRELQSEISHGKIENFDAEFPDKKSQEKLKKLKSKKKRGIAFIAYTIFIFLITGFATHEYDKMLTNIEKKPNIDAVISPYIQKGYNGDFLPLTITNTGDLPLHNVRAAISSCIMKTENRLTPLITLPTTLQPSDQYTIPFEDPKSIKDFENVSCSPYLPQPSISIEYNLGSNETKTSKGVMCGYCNYSVYLFSDEINKTVNSSYPSPVEITTTIKSI